MKLLLPLACFACLIFAGCASVAPQKVYMPSQTSEIAAYYRNGLPIGSLTTDSVLLMVSLEPTEVSGEEYMRLWFLYENKADTAYLLEPLKAIKLKVVGKKKSFADIVPESPTTILARIDNEKAGTMIMQAIGGTLEALSAQPTTVTDPQGGHWTTNDKGEKVKNITSNTLTAMANTSMLYDVFKNSINAGILRRNTIFPGQSVNGYIYFPLPSTVTSWGDVKRVNPERCRFLFDITTQAGNKMIEFIPVEGE